MIDPIRLEIIRGAIRAAQAEMDALLERTAISAFIREKKDSACSPSGSAPAPP
jgi:N-methylhydantoinase B